MAGEIICILIFAAIALAIIGGWQIIKIQKILREDGKNLEEAKQELKGLKKNAEELEKLVKETNEKISELTKKVGKINFNDLYRMRWLQNSFRQFFQVILDKH